MRNPFDALLKANGLVVLDGGLATELERRGADLNDSLWSAKLLIEQPELIRAVHLDYYKAGADVATTASYQATFEGLARRGFNGDAAEALMRKSVELSPQAVSAHSTLAFLLDGQGRTEEAIAEAELEVADWAQRYALAILHYKHGRPEESNRVLGELIATRHQDAALQIAAVYAFQGKPDQAFEWLARAYAQRDAGIAITKAERLFSSLHGDPRWTAFLTKTNLAE